MSLALLLKLKELTLLLLLLKLEEMDLMLLLLLVETASRYWNGLRVM